MLMRVNVAEKGCEAYIYPGEKDLEPYNVLVIPHAYIHNSNKYCNNLTQMMIKQAFNNM